MNRRRALDAALRGSIAAAVFGLAGVAVALMLGFESAPRLLWISALCMACAPSAVLIHVAMTHDLSNTQKRFWLRALTGRKFPWWLAEYMFSDDRASVADTHVDTSAAPGGGASSR